MPLNSKQISELRNLAKTNSRKQCAKLLGVSENSIKGYACSNGIRFHTNEGCYIGKMKLSIEDYQNIMDWYGEVSAIDLGEHFELSPSQVHKIWRGGTRLQKREPWRFDWENINTVREMRGKSKIGV